jgi:uncharacterized metal-binding protein
LASGKSHDASILWFSPLALAGVFYVCPLPWFWVGAVAYAIGGWLLSPDIDLKQSYPSKRWLIFSILWQPYRELSGHRGFSHVPFVGTLSRVLYMGAIALPFLFFAKVDLELLGKLSIPYIQPVFLGLELATWVHLIMDYTPGLNKL